MTSYLSKYSTKVIITYHRHYWYEIFNVNQITDLYKLANATTYHYHLKLKPNSPTRPKLKLKLKSKSTILKP